MKTSFSEIEYARALMITLVPPTREEVDEVIRCLFQYYCSDLRCDIGGDNKKSDIGGDNKKTGVVRFKDDIGKDQIERAMEIIYFWGGYIYLRIAGETTDFSSATWGFDDFTEKRKEALGCSNCGKSGDCRECLKCLLRANLFYSLRFPFDEMKKRVFTAELILEHFGKPISREALAYILKAFPPSESKATKKKDGDVHLAEMNVAKDEQGIIPSKEKETMPIRNRNVSEELREVKEAGKREVKEAAGKKEDKKEEDDAAARKDALKKSCDLLIMGPAGLDAQNRPEPIDFVLPGLVRGDVGALVAAGGVGKSFFTLQLCYSLACDLDITGHFFGGYLPRRRVFYVAREDLRSVLLHRKYVLRARLLAEAQRRAISEPYFDLSKFFKGSDIKGCNVNDFESYSLTDELIDEISSYFFTLNAAGNGTADSKGIKIDLFRTYWQKILFDYVKEYGIDLLILDTLRLCHFEDENDSKKMAELISILKELGSAGCSVIFLHHVSKGAVLNGISSEVAQSSRGSSVLVDNIRWQLNMGVLSESAAKKFKETFSDERNRVFPSIDRRLITCVSCTKINNGKHFDDVTYVKDNYGALVRHDLTPYANGGTKGKVEKQNNKELIED